MALPEFKNEEEFRDQWIAPFLWKLGFMRVKNTHGTGEQGKDFFFADYDRFGHTRIYAAQVKLGNIGSGGVEIAQLLDQVRRCFEVRLAFHKGAHEQNVSGVYVMTSGKISETARQRIHEWCVKNNFGENVFFLDGEQLENKNRFVTYESDQEKRRHYSAFHQELFRNRFHLNQQHHNLLQGIVSFETYRMKSLEDELGRMPEQRPAELRNKFEQLWHILSNFKGWKTPVNITFDDVSKRNILDMTATAFNLSNDLMQYCQEQVKLLDDQYSLEATVVSDSPAN